MRIRMTVAVSPLLALGLTLAACAPQQGGSGVGAATTTEWKEGYGGDSIAIEAVRLIQQTCTTLKRMRAPILKQSLETDVEVPAAICSLLDQGALVIESVKQPKVNGLDKDAANYPDQNPKRLEIKASYWRDPSTTPEKREEMLMHELLPLVKVDDKDYIRSTRLLLAMNTARGIAPDVNCDGHRIGAAIAGANLAMARVIGREIGVQRCFFGLEILKGYEPKNSDHESVKTEFAQAIALGAFVGAVKTSDPKLSEQFENFFVATIETFPVALAMWSPGLCAQDAAKSGNANLCSGLLAFWFGATPEQKGLLVTEEGSSVEFDRASMNFLNRMVRDPKLMRAFLLDNRVDTELVKAAIRSQNWMQLNVLGQVHRALGLPGRASIVMTEGINWEELIDQASRIPMWPGDKRPRPDLHRCFAPSVRTHAESILDGSFPFLRCDHVISI